MGYPPGATYTVSAGDTILAAHYNTQSSDWINNNIPSSIDDTSSNAAAQQVQSDPDGTLATTLAIELQQLRFMLAEITGETYWYTTATGGSLSALTPASLTLAGSAWPSFSVHRNGTQQDNISTTATKIRWTVEEFDTNSDFEIDADDSGGATESRFTPTVAGKYLLSCKLYWTNTVVGDGIQVDISKNGVQYKTGAIYASSTYGETMVTAIVDANGSTDYFEIFALNSVTATSDIFGAAVASYWTGSRIG